MTPRNRILPAIVAVLIWLVPTLGMAAEASPEAPLASTPTDVQLWMAANPGEAVVIVSVTIPDSVELPATVRIPVVEGMTVDWAGEISGGDASQDLQREYVTQEGPQGGSYVEFVVTEFRVAQADLSGKPLTQDGDRVSASLEFVQSTDSSETNLSVRLPAVASDAQIDPRPIGSPTSNQTGETLHVLPTVELGLGEKTTVSVSYSATLPDVPGGGGDAAISTLIGVLAALVAAVLVILVVVLRRSASNRGVSGDGSAEHE